jgi:uncharacterized repeat protein (TIGR02543 family)
VVLLFLLTAITFFSLWHPIVPANALTTQLVLGPVEDVYVDSDVPDSNFGGSSYLYASFWDYEYISDERYNSYLKFDLSLVQTEFGIASATLELYCLSVGYSAPVVGVHYCADDSWNENETTWNNAPSFSVAPTCVVSVLDDEKWYAWDVTKDAKTALDDKMLTIVLSVQNEGGYFYSYFYSKEGWRNPPRLVVEYSAHMSCSVSPSAITFGDSVEVSGCIPVPLYDTVELTYTRPDASHVVRAVATDSDGYFVDTYTPDIVGSWSITAYWEGAEGYNASSSTDIFVVTENRRDNWAIIVGVTDYMEVDDLRYADNDAIDLYNKLKEIWLEDHLKLLVNQEASRSNIESAITNWLAPNETAESVVMFFFSGHGCQGPDEIPIDETDDKDEYICPYDSLMYSYANDIRDDILDTWLGSLDSQHISVFIDSCNSGGFIDKSTREKLSASGFGDGFAKDLSKGGRVVITASDETESSWEYEDLEHGVFTYYILEGLDNLHLVETNGDNKISAEEFFDYVAPLVRVYSDWQQHPQMYDGYEGELILITAAIVNLDTDPYKISIIVDGTSHAAPVSFVWPFYTKHTFSVSRCAGSEYEGTRYSFISWNDGNNLTSRTILVSEFAVTDYNANYKTQHHLSLMSEYGDPQGEGWYDNGTIAEFSVSSPVDYGNGTRVVLEEWSGDVNSTNLGFTVMMDAPKTISANWKRQHYLSVDVEPSGIILSNGERWYDEGSMVQTENAPSEVSGGEGIKYVFETWKVDNLAEGGNSVYVFMDSPHSAVAHYTTQYYLKVESQFGQPKGEGWCEKDSLASFSVESPQGFLIQKVFVGWSGDSTSSSSSATIIMNGPKTVTANWGEENIQLYILVGAAVFLLILIVIVVFKRRGAH